MLGGRYEQPDIEKDLFKLWKNDVDNYVRPICYSNRVHHLRDAFCHLLPAHSGHLSELQWKRMHLFIWKDSRSKLDKLHKLYKKIGHCSRQLFSDTTLLEGFIMAMQTHHGKREYGPDRTGGVLCRNAWSPIWFNIETEMNWGGYRNIEFHKTSSFAYFSSLRFLSETSYYKIQKIWQYY